MLRYRAQGGGVVVNDQRQRQDVEKEDKVREKEERDREEEKHWKILTREIVALGSSVSRMGENICQIKTKVVELEKSYQKLSLEEKANGEVVVNEQFDD